MKAYHTVCKRGDKGASLLVSMHAYLLIRSEAPLNNHLIFNHPTEEGGN